MHLKVLQPTKVVVDEEVVKVIAEAQNGSFCLLPRHIDFVAGLAAGLLSFETTAGEEQFLAVDEGILVKCGLEVLISTRNAVLGPDLGHLQQMVRQQFAVLDQREQMIRSVVARIEADFMRRFLEV